MASKLLIIAFAACTVLAPPALAQTAGDDASVGGAKEELKSKWGDLQREVGDLRGKITSYSQQIGELSDPKTSRAKVAELQVDIGQALAATLDQGEIASLGQKVLDTDKAWLADIYKHGWPPERIAMLEGKFKSTIEKTQHTLDDLAQIRKELAATLRRIQSDGDYLEALARVQQSEEMARVLQSLLHDLQTTSDNLKSIVDDAPGV
jgi:DNA repair ATPase RecN